MEVSLGYLNLVGPEKKKFPPKSGRGGGVRLQTVIKKLRWIRSNGPGPAESPNKSEADTCGVLVVERFLRTCVSKSRMR